MRALTEEANHTAVVHGTGSEQTGAAAERRDGSGVTGAVRLRAAAGTNPAVKCKSNRLLQ